MEYAPYVLFREDGTTHKVRYVARETETNRLVPTLNLHEALRFETAELAYAFGGMNKLNWWRVGRR